MRGAGDDMPRFEDDCRAGYLSYDRWAVMIVFSAVRDLPINSGGDPLWGILFPTLVCKYRCTFAGMRYFYWA